MDIATTKLELMRQLLAIVDEKTLRKVANFFKKEVGIEEGADITDEEVAEFDEAIEQHERGKMKFHTEEESFRLIRSVRK
jgi:hypothetical protein